MSHLKAMLQSIRAAVEEHVSLIEWKRTNSSSSATYAVSGGGAKAQGGGKEVLLPDELAAERHGGRVSTARYASATIDERLKVLSLESDLAQYVHNEAQCDAIISLMESQNSEMLRRSDDLPSVPGDGADDDLTVAAEIGGTLSDDEFDEKYGPVGDVEEKWNSARAEVSGRLEPRAAMVWQERANVDRKRVKVRADHLAVTRHLRFIEQECTKRDAESCELDEDAAALATATRDVSRMEATARMEDDELAAVTAAVQADDKV
jgi:hypothetical protein